MVNTAGCAFMHILHVLPSLDGGGVTKDVLGLTRFLCTQPSIRVSIAAHKTFAASEAVPDDVTLFNLPLHTKNLLRMVRNAFVLQKWVAMKRANIVHVHSRAPAWSCVWAFALNRFLFAPAARLFPALQTYCMPQGCRLISTYHALYEHHTAFHRFYASAMVRGDCVITASAFVHTHITHLFPQKTYALSKKAHCVPRGIDVAFFRPTPALEKQAKLLRKKLPFKPCKKKIFLFVMPARLTPIKGAHVLLQAFHLVYQHCDHMRLLLIGKGKQAYKNYLHNLIDAYRLQDVVTIQPYQKDLRPFYMAADCVAAPSLQPEGFGLVMAEAAAMARPVLTFNHGGAAELFPNTVMAFLAPFANTERQQTENLAAYVMQAVHCDTIDLRDKGIKAQKNINIHFTDKKCYEKTLKIYQNNLL